MNQEEISNSFKFLIGAIVTLCISIFAISRIKNSLIFQGSTDIGPLRSTNEVKEVHLKSNNGDNIHIYYKINRGDSDAIVLFCHGNAGNISHRKHFSSLFDSIGVSWVFFDYPGYGKSDGISCESGCYNAAKTVFEYVTNVLKYKENDITLFGNSLGGAVAVQLCKDTDNCVKNVVVQSSFTSIADVVSDAISGGSIIGSPLTWLIKDFDTKNKLNDIHVPIMFTHSMKDEIIPYGHSIINFDMANEPKYHIDIDGDHNNPLMNQNYMKILTDFIKYSEIGL